MEKVVSVEIRRAKLLFVKLIEVNV